MNRKWKRYIEEEEKTLRKIDELQAYVEQIRTLRRQEEDDEIVKSIRSMNLSARELFDAVNGIRDGSVALTGAALPDTEPGKNETRQDTGKRSGKRSGPADAGDENDGAAKAPERNDGADAAPESEEKEDGFNEQM